MTTTTTDHTKVWQAALGELEVSLPKSNFNTWFRQTHIRSVEGELAIIGVPHTFAQEWLQKKYHGQILTCLRQYYPDVRRVQYYVAAQQSPGQDAGVRLPLPGLRMPAQPSSTPASPEADGTGLNHHSTFETFIVGGSNRLAHAAAVAVSKKLGMTQYNPLYIYGGVGLGKTHLLQAIGNAVQKAWPSKMVIYASCERFTTEFIEALQGKRLEAFKRRYRNADLLLIDDIQFVSGKEATQEEFFHTFNTLHQTNRQIVMTSDTRPQSIPALTPRLSSRFGWGMVADIQTPDSETRQAILRHKCQERSFVLDDESIEYIVQRVQHNIRDLEGSLNAVITHCELYNTKPSLQLIGRILEQIGADQRGRHLSAESILQTVAEFFSIDLGQLLGKRRHKELVYPRQIAMYLMRIEMGASFPKIGKALGGKDHTTVMHGVEKITKELKQSESLQRELSLLKEQLYTT